jgi:hypothetical protein
VASYATNVVPLGGLVCNTLLDSAPTPANGDDVATGAGVFLVARNTDAATRTITVATPETIDGDLAVADRAFLAVPATTGLVVAPLTDRYRDPATGRATLTFSATANLKCIVVRTVV